MITFETNNPCATITTACVHSGAWWDECHAALERYGVTSMCYLTIPFLQEIKLNGVSNACQFRVSHPTQWSDAVGDKPFDHDVSNRH